MPYSRPTDLSDALVVLANHGGRVLAGGTDIYPAASGPLHEHLLDVTDIAALKEITQSEDGWRIGAAVTWSDIVQADLPAAFDGLKAAALQVGSVQIQNAGTLAGNLCNASPAADGVPPLLTLDASVELHSTARGKRLLPLGEFLQGPRQTALEPDELLTAITVPKVSIGARSAFDKLGSRTYLVISISMVAVLIEMSNDGIITRLCVAVGACAPTAQRLSALEREAVGKRPSEIDIAPVHLSPLRPIDDVRGTATYRMEAVAEQIKRAIAQAAAS